VRSANVSETFTYRIGVRIDATVRIESKGSKTIRGFFYINYTAHSQLEKKTLLSSPIHTYHFQPVLKWCDATFKVIYSLVNGNNLAMKTR